MSEQEIEVKDEQEELLEEIDISDIVWDDKGLLEWEEELTVILPSLPTTTQIITQALADLCNKYQIAYNAYNKLMVLANKAENMFKAEKYRLCNEYITKAREKGVKTLPAMDKIEITVINDSKNKRLRMLLQQHQVYEGVKDFFGNNRTKLEKTMVLAKDISYSVNAQDKMYQQAQYHGGIRD